MVISNNEVLKKNKSREEKLMESDKFVVRKFFRKVSELCQQRSSLSDAQYDCVQG